MTGELGFHQAVDGTKDRWEGSGRPRDAVDVFEVETARAFVPQESQVGGAELDRVVGMGYLYYQLPYRSAGEKFKLG